MLVHLVSNDPNDYATVRFELSLNMSDVNVMWRVVSMSSMASFSVTTDDDYMNVTVGDIDLVYQFTEHGSYDINILSSELNTMLSDGLVGEELPLTLTCTINDRGLIELNGDSDFIITDASHRIKLLFGMYHMTLPIQSSSKIRTSSETQSVIQMNSVPYVCYGNVLYLTARTDALALMNAHDGNEETQSIAYKVNEFLYPNAPIIAKLPGSWNCVRMSQLKTLEFRLVDFMLEPVVLHAPLYVTLEIVNPLCANQFQTNSVLIKE